MDHNMIFWDRKISKEEARKVLADGAHPRFADHAALLLSRTNEPRAVFANYLDKKVFCRYWKKIKRQMRLNKWGDQRIIFWDEVHKAAMRQIGHEIAEEKKEKPSAIDETVRAFGALIREMRKAKGWTQKELAKKAGFSQQTVSFIEKGYINVSFLTLKKITDTLGLRISIKEEDSSSTFSTYTS
jgi:HTH-type transcriptional regulator/antitoxin HipB